MFMKCIFLVLLMATIALSQSFTGLCTKAFGTNKYDLSGANNAKQDYTQSDSAGNKYYFQPCAFTVFGCTNNVAGSTVRTNFCQQDAAKPPNNHSLGNPAGGVWTEIPGGSGVTINMTGGDNGRQSSFICQCQKGASSSLSSITEVTTTKLYTLTFISKDCCAGAGGGGGGTGKKKSHSITAGFLL